MGHTFLLLTVFSITHAVKDILRLFVFVMGKMRSAKYPLEHKSILQTT